MSYDLDLFVPQGGYDPVDILQNAAFHKSDPETAINLQMVQQLVADNPQFELVAGVDSINVNDPTDGVQIALYSHTARVSIPYWHTNERVIRLVFTSLRRSLRTILNSTTYELYDPQLKRIVDLDEDFGDMLAQYTQNVEGMQSFFGG